MNKPKIITITLLIMTVGLMLSIFYIGFQLTNSSEKSNSLAPKKTKAQSVNYNMIVPVDQGATGNNSNSDSFQEKKSSSPTISISPRLTQRNPNPSPSITRKNSRLSPTEKLLALNQVSPQVSPTLTSTIEPTLTKSASSSATPTNPKTLPKTGTITNALVIFGIASSIIFFSFLF